MVGDEAAETGRQTFCQVNDTVFILETVRNQWRVLDRQRKARFGC
jgi:hypothetical protein